MLETRTDGFFQGGDLVLETRQNGQRAGDRQDLVGLREQTRKVWCIELVNLLDTQAPTRVARQDVLHTECLGGVVSHEVSALTPYIPHGPL